MRSGVEELLGRGTEENCVLALVVATTLPLAWQGARPAPSKCHLPHPQNGSRGDPFCFGLPRKFCTLFLQSRLKGKLTLSSRLEVELQVFCEKGFC